MAHAISLFPTSVKDGFLTRDGRFQVRRICEELGVGAADFARLTGRSTEAVARLFRTDEPTELRDETSIRVLRELIQLQGVLHAIGLPADEREAWMHTPLPSFDGKTPEEVIAEGRGQRLVARLLAYSSGNVAT